MPFPIILRHRISEFRTSTGILYLHTLTAFVSEILLVRTISASSTNGQIPSTFHEIFRKCHFVYTKVKEYFLFLWPRTYLRLLSCHNPNSAAQR